MIDIEENKTIPPVSEVAVSDIKTEDDSLSIAEVLSTLPSNRQQLSLLDIYIIIINIISINITVLCFSTKEATLSYYCCSYLLSVSFVLVMLSRPKDEVVKNSSIASFILACILFTGLLPYNHFFLLLSNEKYDQYVKNLIGITQAVISIGCIFTIPQKHEKIIAIGQIILSVTFPYNTHFYDKTSILGTMELQVNLFVIIWYFELFTSYLLNDSPYTRINTKKLVIISIPVLRLKGFLYVVYAVFYLSAHGFLVFKHLKRLRKDKPELFRPYLKTNDDNNNNNNDNDDDDDGEEGGDLTSILDEPKTPPVTTSTIPPVTTTTTTTKQEEGSGTKLVSRKKIKTVKFSEDPPYKKTQKKKTKSIYISPKTETTTATTITTTEPRQPTDIDFNIKDYIINIQPLETGDG